MFHSPILKLICSERTIVLVGVQAVVSGQKRYNISSSPIYELTPTIFIVNYKLRREEEKLSLAGNLKAETAREGNQRV